MILSRKGKKMISRKERKFSVVRGVVRFQGSSDSHTVIL